jgi:putative hydrolase of the HAD superfamily
MIQAVVFDWGGVLIEDPAPGLVATTARHLGIPAASMASALDRYGADFQRGRLTEPEFWDRVCHTCSCALPTLPSLWGHAFQAVYRPRPAMFALAIFLRQRGLKTGLLSNTEQAARAYFQTRGYDMFDACIFSCDQGVIKPEPSIYARVLEGLRVAPEQAVFLDDRQAYVDGALGVGMQALRFESVSACLAGLKDLGVPVP